MEEKDFSLVFSGEGIRPETISARELADLISSFEQGLVADLKKRNPEINSDDVIIGLIEVSSNSAHFKFTSSFLQKTVASLLAIGVAVNSGDASELDAKTQESIKKIQSYTQKKSCGASFQLGQNSETPVMRITENAKINYSERSTCSGDTVVYGILERIGGATPKASIRTSRGAVISCDITKEQAEQLAPKLYKPISISGQAKWSTKDNEMLAFTVAEIGDYENFSITECLQEIGNISAKYWDEVEDVIEAVSQIRRGDY